MSGLSKQQADAIIAASTKNLFKSNDVKFNDTNGLVESLMDGEVTVRLTFSHGGELVVAGQSPTTLNVQEGETIDIWMNRTTPNEIRTTYKGQTMYGGDQDVWNALNALPQ